VKIKREGGENYGGWKVGEREKMKKGLLFSSYSYPLREVGVTAHVDSTIIAVHNTIRQARVS